MGSDIVSGNGYPLGARGSDGAMIKVGVVQRVLPHYRIPFFVGLADRLAQENVQLKLIYGQEYPGTVPMTCEYHGSWAHKIKNRYLRMPGVELVWQPCIHEVSDCNLVIIEQSNRLMVNYLLMARRHHGKYKLAFWGHGRNMQSLQREGFRERLKRGLIRSVDWWFAYTKLTADIVTATGFPRENITVVQNAVSTNEFDYQMHGLAPGELRAVQTRIGIHSQNVGVYCGGMYADKKLGFLIEACEAIRSTVPDFEVIIIGEGPEQYIVEAAARRNHWLHYIGPKYGVDRVAYLLSARVLLMPGLVGLAVVDSFAARVPLFTTDIPTHSPEISYLENGINGVITAHSVREYANIVASYLQSDERLNVLRQGCTVSAKQYTVANMIENFAEGVMRCLAI